MCVKKFKNSRGLANHIAMVHNNGENEDSGNRNPNKYCDRCNKTFGKSKYLKRHYKRVHPTEELELESNINENENMSEILTKNGIDTSKIYKCGLCETSFSNAKGLTRHIDSVHLKKKFRCNICSKEFNSKDNIMAHTKKFHEGRNIFQAIANDEKKEEDPPQQVIRGLY